MAGQREWGWVSQQLGFPNFPQDFPDCPAAADLAQLLATEQVSPVLLLLLVVFPTMTHCLFSCTVERNHTAVESSVSFSVLFVSLLLAEACLMPSFAILVHKCSAFGFQLFSNLSL